MADPVACAPPLGAPAALLDPVVDHRLPYEHPGHAGTTTPTATGMDDLADALLAGHDRVALVGAGFGGMVALTAALAHPDRVTRLALLCTSARPGGEVVWRDRARTVRERGLASIADAVVERWGHPELRDALLTCSDEGYAACCDAVAGFDVLDRLHELTLPTLVVSGLEDRGLPSTHSAELAAAIPGAELAELPGAGHLPFVDRPDAVRALLARA